MKKKKEDNMETDVPTPKEELVQEELETISVSDLMQESLQKATSDASEFKDKYFRALAEMENLRKRLSQEKKETIAYAINNMLSEFLTPLENLENALRYTDNLSDELKNWAVGFKMIVGQFKSVLENYDIVPFESLGRQFDVHFHEAIELVESDKPEGTVIEEIQKGYKHGDRVLRVAKVKVAKSST